MEECFYLDLFSHMAKIWSKKYRNFVLYSFNYLCQKYKPDEALVAPVVNFSLHFLNLSILLVSLRLELSVLCINLIEVLLVHFSYLVFSPASFLGNVGLLCIES